MNQYHKIQTVFLRDPDTNYKTLLEGQFSRPEFQYLRENCWEFTEKVDGTNIRIIWDGSNYSVAGKTDRAQLSASLVSSILDSLVGVNPESPMTLYGEGYGPKIQNGGKYRSDQSFVLFDVFCGGLWLERSSVQNIGDKLGIDVVPVVQYGTLDDMIDLVRSKPQSRWGDFRMEGVVARPLTGLISRRGERVITKLKCKDFKVAD